MKFFQNSIRSQTISISWIIGLFVFGQSCREEIELPHHIGTEKIIIEGQLSNELKRHLVSVKTSRGSRSNESSVGLSGLIVYLTVLENQFMLTEEEPGHYWTDSMVAVSGLEYTLTVETEEKIYRAKDKMPPIPKDFTPVSFGQENGFLDLEFRRHQFGFPEANQWEIHLERTDTFPGFYRIDPTQLGKQIGVQVSEDLNYTFTYFTHPNIEVNGLLNFDIPHFFGFNPGFIVTQKKYNLSEEYYQFLRAVFMETEWRGTLFPSVPANVTGNIDNGALGFFSTVTVRSKTFKPE